MRESAYVSCSKPQMYLPIPIVVGITARGQGRGRMGKKKIGSSDGDEGFGLLVDDYQEPLPGARAQLFLQYLPLVLMDLAGSDHTTLPSSDSSNVH